MRSLFLLVLAFVLSTGQVLACDACGCAAGANFLGILPQVEKNLFGYRFLYNYFPAPPAENTEVPGAFLEDTYRQHDLWFRLYPTERWQLFINVPYKVNTRVWNDRSVTLEGLGDISLMAHYLLVQPDSGATGWQHFFRFGPMVKMPTGKYQQRDGNLAMLPAMMQTGNGAWGLGANAVYTVRNRNWGTNVALQANWNTANELKYQLGSQYSGALTLFYSRDVKRWNFMPQVGLMVEYFDVDQGAFGPETATGASRINGQIGVDAYVGRLMLSAFGVIPLAQEVPTSQPLFAYRVGGSVNWFF
jgi:hypothetical protein